MAGIGFRLQKLLTSESYSDLVRAYLYSSVIAAGPMLIVILSLSGIKFFTQVTLELEEGKLFLGLIVYIYAFSMLGVAPFLYIITRYIADKFYLKETDAFTPTFFSSLLIVFPIQALVAILFLDPLSFSLTERLVAISLYLFINGTWLAMLFLSAARSYLWIVWAFLAGGLFGVLGCWLLGESYGLAGFLAGYTLGQGLTFFILTARIFIEFGFEKPTDFGFLSYAKKHPYFVGIGFFYYLGIWIDKFIFWFSPQGERVGERMWVFQNYDTPMFMAFLTIVPSMAFFLIQMETSFVRTYSAYFQAIRQRSPLSVIKLQRQAIMDTLSSQFQKFVLFQGVLSGLVILFVYEIADAFFLNPYQLGIFRIGIVGSFLLMGWMMVLNIFFYFDFQKEAFLSCLIFFSLNALFTLGTLWMGLPAYGFGFGAACFVVLMLSFLLLNTKLAALDYWTFMRQPVLIPKFKLEKE